MNTQSIINIKGNDKIFNYVIRYTPSNIQRGVTNISYYQEGNNIYFLDNDKISETSRLIRKENDWISEVGFAEGQTQYIPWDDTENLPIYSEANIDLLFPDFSVDTYEKGVKYALTVNTWIHGKCIWLGSWIIDRLDSLAINTGIERIQSTNYSDYQSFTIIDPYELMYSDKWADWRQIVCGEPKDTNAVGSIISITLYPVRKCESENEYIMLEGYTGGGSGMNIDLNNNNNLNLNLSFDCVEKSFSVKLGMNQEYNEDLKIYMSETYGIDVKSIRWELIAKDEENAYGVWIYTDSDNVLETSTKFDNITFDDWTGWKEGIFMQSGISIIDQNDIECISILSNKIPLTQELFSYIINLNDFPKSIDLETIDMKNYTINAVNKIQKNIIQMANPQDSKSGMILPMFFQTREVGEIIIHPAVTEVIAINLDAYKSQVNTFIIQIEGVTFTEIGRTGKGVLFKIVGTTLPNQITEGTYYILNENGDMVTNGKYIYNG